MFIVPELPEVETVVRRIRPDLVGSHFTGVSVLWERMVQTPLEAFYRDLPGRTILAVDRRGKYLVLTLSGGLTLLLHLKMTGDLRVVPAETEADPYARIIFGLNANRQLRFRDPRKFGRVYLTAEPQVVLGKLGPEPLGEALSEDAFVERLNGRRRKIKPFLLDQSFVAGLGNIYADEILFAAGIHPSRRTDDLSDEDKHRLYHAMRAVLRQAIGQRGSTLADRMYRGGQYQEQLQVYDREGEPCAACGTKIVRIRLAQRSAHFCPKCQT